MNNTMTGREVALARRMIGLRGTQFTARRKTWRQRFKSDLPVLAKLIAKQHVGADSADPKAFTLTGQGIQQLKQQIGEFRIVRVA